MSVIETQGLTRRFGELTPVDSLTISVEPGEVFALLGVNGAGKTVTMKMLTTLLRPSTGNVRVAGFVSGRTARGPRAGLPKVLLGNVAERVLRTASCPVLTAGR